MVFGMGGAAAPRRDGFKIQIFSFERGAALV